MDWALAVCAVTGERANLEMMLYRTLIRLTPRPSRLVIFDNGRRSEVQAGLRERTLPTGVASAIFVHGQKRRLSGEAAFGRLWQMAASQSCRHVLLMTDDHVLSRGVNMIDAAHVLDREPSLVGLEFAASDVDAKPADRRGSGTVPWLVSGRLHGWPVLMRTETLRQFPWPRGGASELENGILSALAGSTFGIWGVGDPWAALT